MRRAATSADHVACTAAPCLHIEATSGVTNCTLLSRRGDGSNDPLRKPENTQQLERLASDRTGLQFCTSALLHYAASQLQPACYPGGVTNCTLLSGWDDGSNDPPCTLKILLQLERLASDRPQHACTRLGCAAHGAPAAPILLPTQIAPHGCCMAPTVSLLPVPAGDYDTYVRTRAELEENQMKKYKWEQEQVGLGVDTEAPWCAMPKIEWQRVLAACRLSLNHASLAPASADRQHEGVHCAVRPWLRQAGTAGTGARQLLGGWSHDAACHARKQRACRNSLLPAPS